MLVLSRKQCETVVIADRIRVTVEHISKSRVRLRIDAPDEVAVDRDEVWRKKRKGVRSLAAPLLGERHGFSAQPTRRSR